MTNDFDDRDGVIDNFDGVPLEQTRLYWRPSNTEPLMPLNLESLVSREHLEEKRDELLELIRA